MYRHKIQYTKDTVDNQKKINDFEEEIAKLEAEICDLKNNVELKEKELEVKITKEANESKSFNDLIDENKQLKDIIEKYEEANASAMDEKETKILNLSFQNRDLQKQIDCKNSSIDNLNYKLCDSDGK